jgi:hypothetical protein
MLKLVYAIFENLDVPRLCIGLNTRVCGVILRQFVLIVEFLNICILSITLDRHLALAAYENLGDRLNHWSANCNSLTYLDFELEKEVSER